MVCLIESDPKVREQIQNLADKLGTEYDIAKIILQENNGYDLDKAPNGAESKLYKDLLEIFNGDEQQALIAKSKTYLQPFFNWFGEWTSDDKTNVSKVVDENGEPLVVYHGSAKQFNAFKLDKIGSMSGDKSGFYFTNKRKIAKDYYSKETGSALGNLKLLFHIGNEYKSSVYDVFLNSKNPYIVKVSDKEYITREQIIKEAKEKGYDSVLFNNVIDGPTVIQDVRIVFNPNQIKSVLNEGQFSTTDNNIYKSVQSNNTSSDPTLQERLFKGKTEVSIGTMLTRLKADNPIHKAIITLLQNNLSTATKGWKIVLTDLDNHPIYGGSSASALYDHNTHRIYVNVFGSFRTKNGKADLTILHEIIHAAAVDASNKNENIKNELESMLSHIRRKLEDKYGMSYQKLIKTNFNTFYGLTDINELLSESISNAAFIKELMSIPASKSTFKVYLDEFINFLAKIFGITKTDTAYHEVYSQLYDIIVNQQQYNEQFNASNQYQNYNENDIYEQIDELRFSRSVQNIRTDEDVNKLVSEYKKLSSDIEFDEVNHTYTNRKTGQVYKPVSQVKTDTGYGEQEDKLPAHAVQLGNFTKQLGTKMHNILSEMLTGKFDSSKHKDVSDKVIKQLNKIANDIRSKYQIIASEQILADDKTGIAGTADLIVRDKKNNRIILLDFKTKIRNLGDTKKSGFSYYHSSKFGKPDVDKHNFQLTMYEKLHNILGFEIDERGIVPIEYDADENGNITSVYLTQQTKGTTLEDKGYYTIPHRSQIDQDIRSYVFGEDPINSIDEEQISRQKDIIESILNTLKNKVVNLYSKGRTTQAMDIENMVNEFTSLSEKEIIVSYIQSALENLSNIINGKKGYLERLNEEKTKGSAVWNLKQLENWRDVARSFQPLENIQQYLFDYKELFDKDEYDNLMPILDQAIRYRDILEGAYRSKGKNIWIEWIKPFITNVEGAYRLKAEREYKKNHKQVDKEEMQKYIEKYIQDNRQNIEIETKNFIDQQSKLADADINGLYRWVDTIFQSKDPIISGMALAYDQMIQQTNETYNVKYKQLVDLVREMESKFGSSIFSDPRSVYDYMLDVTDDGIKLISEIPESFRVAYKLAMAEIEQSTDYATKFDKFKAKMKWVDENAPIKDKQALKKAKYEAIKQYLDSIDITEEEYNAILDNEKLTGKTRQSYFELAKNGIISYKRADDLRQISEDITWKFRTVDPKKFPNKKWEYLQNLRNTDPNNIQVRFFYFIKNLADEGDSRVAPRYKLNGRIPGISKTSLERISAGQSAFQVFKEQLSKDFQLKADDTMYGQFELADELNNPVNYIPVFFTNRLKESDQSFDIPTIYKEWFKSALRYANTNEIIDQLEFTRYIVNTRKTKTGGLSYATRAWKRLNPDSQISEQWTTKDSSNLAQQLNDWFDQIVYGKGTDTMGALDIPLVGKVDAGKLVNSFQKYTSLRIMGLNYISMVNNALMAEVAQAVETSAGKYVSAKSYTKATAEYTLDLPNILADLGSRKPTSKTNLLDELFGIFTEYDNGKMRLSNKFSKLFNSGSFYFTTNLGEHEAQSRFLIASLIEKRALDKNGNDIGSIYDYYEVVDDQLVFDKDGKVANWSTQDRRNFSSKVRSQLMSMHGNYSNEYKVALQRNGYLRLALMFRKWIIPSWRKRYDTMYYDNVTQDYKEGYYRTGGRFYADKVKQFFYKLTDESRAAEIAITSDWNNLTEMEKQNVKRFSTEVAVFISMCILFSLLKDYIGDDDEPALANLAYQVYRLRTDIGFYTNPMDMMKIIQSPFPSTSAVRGISNLFDAALHPFDVYERGNWEGHYKIEKRVYDMMPIVRQLYRAKDIENEYNILNMQ